MNTIIELYDAIFIKLDITGDYIIIYKNGLVKVFSEYEKYEVNCSKINYYKRERTWKLYTDEGVKTIRSYFFERDIDFNLIAEVLKRKKCNIKINVYEQRNLIGLILELFVDKKENGAYKDLGKKIYFATYTAVTESHAKPELIDNLKEYFLNEKKNISPSCINIVVTALNDAAKTLQYAQKLNGKISESSLKKDDIILLIKQCLVENEDPIDVINETIKLLKYRNATSREIEKFKIECDKFLRTVVLLSNRILCIDNHKGSEKGKDDELTCGVFGVLRGAKRHHLYILIEKVGELLTNIDFDDN